MLLQESLIAELRSVNACLEREVGELEEERRRLKAHLKFKAKHQAELELPLELTPEQLSAVESVIAKLQGKSKVSNCWWSCAMFGVLLLNKQYFPCIII